MSRILDGKLRTDGGDGVKLLEILLDIEPQGGHVQNTRHFKFLVVKETKTRADGLLFRTSGRQVEGLFDYFGNPFFIELNKKGQEQLAFRLGGKHVALNDCLVAVYSAGADGKLGTADDITSW